MLRTCLRVALAALLISLAPRTIAAAQPAVATPVAALSIGNVHFDKYGPPVDPGPALILIPGLSMGAWTWTNTIAAFASDHVVYAATLAGFDGMPPAQPPYIDQADAAIVQLVKQENLNKPVLVGHSFGGHVALRLVEEHSDLFGGAVLVDATPYFPPLQAGQTAEQRAQNIELLAEGIAEAPDVVYDEQTHAMAAQMVTGPQAADLVAQHSLRSDRTTLAGTTREMSNEDLRGGLPRISAPLLVIAPVSQQAPYMSDALRALSAADLDRTIHDYFASQFPGAKTLSVQTIDNSKDFVMLDQPDALNAAIRQFLNNLLK